MPFRCNAPTREPIFGAGGARKLGRAFPSPPTKLLVTAFLVLSAPLAFSQQVVIGASLDNTLYETAAGGTSNGQGEMLVIGKVGAIGGLTLRRAVLAFDLAAAIPADATITGVSLSLRLTNPETVSPIDVSVHRLLASWGEGSSDAGEIGGVGATAAAGDATWRHRSYPDVFWTTPGGDFAATVSAQLRVTSGGFYAFSSEQMTADVQSWLSAPETNAGWIIRGDEVTARLARRIDSAESPTPQFRPALTIDYVLIPEPAGVSLLALGGTALLAVRRPRR